MISSRPGRVLVGDEETKTGCSSIGGLNRTIISVLLVPT